MHNEMTKFMSESETQAVHRDCGLDENDMGCISNGAGVCNGIKLPRQISDRYYYDVGRLKDLNKI